MKWHAITVNVNKARKTYNESGVIVRMFFTLMSYSFLTIILLGLAGYAQEKFGAKEPSSSMKGLAASVSSTFFKDMIGMELPLMQTDRQSFTFSQQNVGSFLFSLVTDINPSDPKTLLAREVPNLANDQSVVLRPASTAGSDSPADYGPKMNVLDTTQGPGGIHDPGALVQPVHGPPVPTAAPPKSAGKNVAFVYQSHNQESYLPELPGVTDPDKAYDAKKNVSLVGSRLAQKLEQEGIGAVHSDTNYPAAIKDFNYYLSYKYSLKTLQDAAVAHPDLSYYFDIHRDSQKREKTTITVDGKSYAQVYFIIGGKNPNWKQNEQFASQIHDALEAKVPGISKGIHAKAADGNGVYNQNFSSTSALIEIGGVDNSFEECYRTADILAAAIAEVITNAHKVDAPTDKQDGKKQG